MSQMLSVIICLTCLPCLAYQCSLGSFLERTPCIKILISGSAFRRMQSSGYFILTAHRLKTQILSMLHLSSSPRLWVLLQGQTGDKSSCLGLLSDRLPGDECCLPRVPPALPINLQSHSLASVRPHHLGAALLLPTPPLVCKAPMQPGQQLFCEAVRCPSESWSCPLPFRTR